MAAFVMSSFEAPRQACDYRDCTPAVEAGRQPMQNQADDAMRIQQAQSGLEMLEGDIKYVGAPAAQAHLTLSATVTTLTHPAQIQVPFEDSPDGRVWFVTGLRLCGACWVPLSQAEQTAPTEVDSASLARGNTAAGRFLQRPQQGLLPVVALRPWRAWRGLQQAAHEQLTQLVPVYQCRRRSKCLVAALDFSHSGHDNGWAAAASIHLDDWAAADGRSSRLS